MPCQHLPAAEATTPRAPPIERAPPPRRCRVYNFPSHTDYYYTLSRHRSGAQLESIITFLQYSGAGDTGRAASLTPKSDFR